MNLINKKFLYKICPECDFFCNVGEPDKYCSSCGSVLADKCKKCGHEISNPYARHCKYCGELYRENTVSEKLKKF